MTPDDQIQRRKSPEPNPTTRWRQIRPPRLDPDNPFPSTDCQHDDLIDLFFEPDEERGIHSASAARSRIALARRVCAECPFLVECAIHGLEHEDYGVWGGLDERDRRLLGGRGISYRGGNTPKDPAKAVATVLLAAGAPQTSVERLLRTWGRILKTRKAAA